MKKLVHHWWQSRGKYTWYIFIPGVVFVVLIAAIASFILANERAQDVHIHAGFHVYVNGVKQDYSGLEHMFLEPCGEMDNHNEDIRHKVHLHDKVGDVTHIHAPGVTWGDLFTSVGITKAGDLRAYVNGKSVDGNQIFSTLIQDHDSAVFIYGDNASIDLTQLLAAAPTPGYIDQIAAKSTGCGSETK